MIFYGLDLFTNISEHVSVDQNIRAVGNKKSHHASVGELAVDDVDILHRKLLEGCFKN